MPPVHKLLHITLDTTARQPLLPRFSLPLVATEHLLRHDIVFTEHFAHPQHGFYRAFAQAQHCVYRADAQTQHSVYRAPSQTPTFPAPLPGVLLGKTGTPPSPRKGHSLEAPPRQAAPLVGGLRLLPRHLALLGGLRWLLERL